MLGVLTVVAVFAHAHVEVARIGRIGGEADARAQFAGNFARVH